MGIFLPEGTGGMPKRDSKRDSRNCTPARLVRTGLRVLYLTCLLVVFAVFLSVPGLAVQRAGLPSGTRAVQAETLKDQSGSGGSAARIYEFENIKPGLTGKGRTVFRGTQIEEFDVEFLGVLRNQGPSGDLALVRLSGDAIDEAGGIAAGMSGSPVYVNGRLVGAIGYAFDLTDHREALLTPIDDMLELLEMVETPPPKKEDTTTEDTTTRVVVETATPVMYSGISPRALEYLKRNFPVRNLKFVPAGGSTSGVSAEGSSTARTPDSSEPGSRLQPGSSFGIQLTRGDVETTAIGTITYIAPDGRFVGLGHPFNNLGAVNYMVSEVEILHTVKSLELPFKIGSTGAVAGSISQDRGAGVAGILGVPADTVKVRVNVTDLDRMRTRTSHVEVIKDQTMTPSLVTTAVLSLLDKGIDRIGPGSADVDFSISGAQLPRDLSRANVFYSPADISALALSEVGEAVDLILNNQFQEVDIDEIEFSARISSKRNTARIEKATPSSTNVNPGEDLQVEITIRPYRAALQTRTMTLELPDNLAPGPYTVVVRGGGSYISSPELDVPAHAAEDQSEESNDKAPHGDETGDELSGFTESQDSLDKMLEEFSTRETSDQIIMELTPYYNYDSNQSQEAADQTNPEPIKVQLETEYVIEGSVTFEFTLNAPAVEPEPQKGGQDETVPVSD